MKVFLGHIDESKIAPLDINNMDSIKSAILGNVEEKQQDFLNNIGYFNFYNDDTEEDFIGTRTTPLMLDISSLIMEDRHHEWCRLECEMEINSESWTVYILVNNRSNDG